MCDVCSSPIDASQFHHEAASAALTWHILHFAAMMAGNFAHQCQAEADPAIAFLGARGPVERQEDALALFLRNSGAAVAYGGADCIVRNPLDPAFHRRAGTVAPRILEQVA